MGDDSVKKPLVTLLREFGLPRARRWFFTGLVALLLAFVLPALATRSTAHIAMDVGLFCFPAGLVATPIGLVLFLAVGIRALVKRRAATAKETGAE